MLVKKCGNEHHPNGPMHPMARPPKGLALRKRLVHMIRRLRWGCSCPELGERDVRVDMVIRIPNLRQQQAAALYCMFEEMRTLGSIGSSRWITIFSDGDGPYRPRPEIQISKHGPAIALWAKEAGKRTASGSLQIDEDFVAWRMFHQDQREAPE